MNFNDLPHNVKSFKLLMEHKFKTVLDVGAGKNSLFDKIMAESGAEVDTADLLPDATYSGNYMDLKIDKRYDAILCYNCAEHQLNLNNFLLKLHENLKEDGILALSVPAWKNTIVDGHVVAFPNAGLLLYNLVMARWDCSSAKVSTFTDGTTRLSQIAVIIKRSKLIDLPDNLTTGKGDLRKLYNFFPDPVKNRINHSDSMSVNSRGSFNGAFDDINWFSGF